MSSCVEFHRLSSHDLEEWCLLTFRCLHSHIHFSNVFTEADACLKRKSSPDENLIPVSTKLIFKKKLEPRHLQSLLG